MTDTPMTPEYEQQIRSHVAEMSNYSLGNLFARDLLAEVDRLRKALSEAADQVAELDDELGKASSEAAALRQRLHEAAMARVWTNEDGKKFVFADDLKGPLLGKTPLHGQARLDARATQEAEATHWKRLGIDPPEAWGTPAPRAVKRARPRNPRTCSRCGDTPAQWCPDCEACRLGCFATRAANPCTHPNAPWNTEPTP
ncbi:hypothetical protein [Streptomyces rubiginosohelvolus]